MEEVATTDYERMMVDAFYKYGGDSTPVTQHIFCFKCHEYFHWAKSELPKVCLKCHETVEYAEIARPDIIVVQGNDTDLIAVVRVQGGIHYKDRKKKKYDREQMLKFLQCGVPVFDVTNEEAEFMHDHSWPLISFVIMVETMLDGDDDYKMYMNNPEIKARWTVI